jgi:hypothetical protein
MTEVHHMLRIAEFEPIASATGALYRPRVYGDGRDASWDGYIVFFPLGSGPVISTPVETTQSTIESLQEWSVSLDSVYLEGALARALAATSGVAMPATIAEFELAAAETLAAGDAIALHRAADRAAAEAASELAAADMHEHAAAAARENATRLARQKDELEQLARQTTRIAAEAAAEAHEGVAREARTIAADAARLKKPKRSRRKPSTSPRKKRN